MKSYLNWQISGESEANKQNFYALSQSNASLNNRGLSVKLNDVWQSAIAHLELSSEPHVWRTQDTAGRTAWSAYAPATKQSIQQVSALELRIWLEEQQAQDAAMASQNAQQFKARNPLGNF